MKSSRCMLMLASLIASTLIAQDAQVTPLMSKDLADFPGKEGLMITVVYPPGASDPIHRHNAHAFVYVLEGSIVMQVKGGKEITLTPGQSFMKGPTIFIPLAGTQAARNQRSSSWSCSRTRERLCWYQLTRHQRASLRRSSMKRRDEQVQETNDNALYRNGRPGIARELQSPSPDFPHSA